MKPISLDRRAWLRGMAGAACTAMVPLASTAFAVIEKTDGQPVPSVPAPLAWRIDEAARGIWSFIPQSIFLP